MPVQAIQVKSKIGTGILKRMGMEMKLSEVTIGR
jgi:hypothetical protein